MPGPGQTLAAWRAELRQALALAGDHLSLYQLTIEPGTAFEAGHGAARSCCRMRTTAAALYEATAEEAARGRAAGLRDVELRPARAPKAGTTSPIGATATMPASAPARMAG